MLPLVMVPAMLCDAELYGAQLAALGDAAEITIEPVAARPLPEAARACLDRAPERFALAGTSAGGNLALEIVATAPERVAGLWLMGSNPGSHGDPDGARAQSARAGRAPRPPPTRSAAWPAAPEPPGSSRRTTR